MSNQHEKRSLSYEQLMRRDHRAEIEKLADADMLDDATLSRAAHLGRFFEKLRAAGPNPDLQISPILNADEVQKIWRDTADEDADPGQCPLLS
jgi:hypothetical protein